MIRGEHGVELPPQCPHEHRVGGQRAGRDEGLRRGAQHPVVLVSEQPRFARVRIERAQREPRARDAPPVPQRRFRDPAGAHHTLRGHGARHVAQWEMSGDEHDAERPGGEHHRDVTVASEVSQELRKAGVAKTREMQRVLVHRPRHDRVCFAPQCEAYGLFHRAHCDPAR